MARHNGEKATIFKGAGAHLPSQADWATVCKKRRRMVRVVGASWRKRAGSGERAAKYLSLTSTAVSTLHSLPAHSTVAGKLSTLLNRQAPPLVPGSHRALYSPEFVRFSSSRTRYGSVVLP